MLRRHHGKAAERSSQYKRYAAHKRFHKRLPSCNMGSLYHLRVCRHLPLSFRFHFADDGAEWLKSDIAAVTADSSYSTARNGTRSDEGWSALLKILTSQRNARSLEVTNKSSPIIEDTLGILRRMNNTRTAWKNITAWNVAPSNCLRVPPYQEIGNIFWFLVTRRDFWRVRLLFLKGWKVPIGWIYWRATLLCASA